MARGTGADSCDAARTRGGSTVERPLLVDGVVDVEALAARLESLPDRSGRVEGLGPLVWMSKANARSYYVMPTGGSRLHSRQPHGAAEAAAYGAEIVATGKPKRRAWLDLPPPTPAADETPSSYHTRLKAWTDQAYPKKLGFMFGRKTHVQLAHAAASQMHALTCRMPWIVRGFKGMDVYADAWYSRKGTHLDGCTWGLFQQGSIYLNPAWWENEPRFRRELARSTATGFHPNGCDTPESVVSHEVGHLIDHMLDRDAKHRVAWMQFKQQAREQGLQLPSQYALKNGMEAVAESFAEIIHSRLELSPYATALKAFLVECKLLPAD